MTVVDEQLTETLRARGRRVTSQRLVIHRLLHELGTHATVEDVFDAVAERLPGVSLPTVYATLELLEEIGAVRRVAIPGGPALYDPRTDPHHHFICRACGRATDVDADVELGPALRAAARHGLAVSHAEVLIAGTCDKCS
jgi:Fe2+ or Zn2+ uptake regulation protein